MPTLVDAGDTLMAQLKRCVQMITVENFESMRPLIAELKTRNNLMVYLFEHPHVPYTVSPDGEVTITADEWKVHFKLSTGGQK